MVEEEEEEDDRKCPSSNYYECQNHQHNYLSIFSPINHEGLSIPRTPPPPRAPLSLSSADSDSHPPTPKPPRYDSHFGKWFDFALRFWNSKLKYFLTHVRSLGFFSSLRLAAAVLPFLFVFWFWVRRRRKRGGGEESVEHMKLLIEEKDEKIHELLQQISEMNKLLLARFRLPVLKKSG